MSKKYEAAETRLNKYVEQETEWNNAYDKVMDATKDIDNRYGHFTAGNEAQAIRYANAVAGKLDEEAYDEAQDISVNYDTLKTFYETELTVLQAQKQAIQTQLGTAAADTGMLTAG